MNKINNKTVGLEKDRDNYKLITKEENIEFKIAIDRYNIKSLKLKFKLKYNEKIRVKINVYRYSSDEILGESTIDGIKQGWNEFVFPIIYGIQSEKIRCTISVDSDVEVATDSFNDILYEKKSIDVDKEVAQELDKVSKELNTIYGSNGWKVLSKFYSLKHGTVDIMKAIRKSFNVLIIVFKSINPSTIIRGFDYLKDNGVKAFIYKAFNKLKGDRIKYMEWLKTNLPTVQELERQKNVKFEYEPCISILMPTYKTPIHLLHETIKSVLNQTYNNWEFCIVDGNSEDKELEDTLKEYAKNDERFKIKFIDENRGIAGNTQECYYLATGDYIGLFDHDDLLEPNALYEIVDTINKDRTIDFIYTDEDKINEKSDLRFDPNFKQDFSIDTFRSCNYICHFSVFRSDLMKKIDGFRDGYNGSQDYDIILRATEQAYNIYHIPKILYSWRVHSGSTAGNPKNKMYCYDSAKLALNDHLKRCGIEGEAHSGRFIGTYDIEYKLDLDNKVSIIIDSYKNAKKTYNTIKNIKNTTEFKNYEIVVVINENIEEADILEGLVSDDCVVNVVKYNESLSKAQVRNFGAKNSTGNILLFMNSDMEPINKEWLSKLVGLTQRNDVGCVGAKLYYADNTIQHGGIIVGINGNVGTAHRNFRKKEYGYFLRLGITHNISAVSADCLMVKRIDFELNDGFDEEFSDTLYDVDFCLRLIQRGKVNIWTPNAELYNYISKNKAKKPIIIEEHKQYYELFGKRYSNYIEKGDPYYSPNLTLNSEDFSLRG